MLSPVAGRLRRIGIARRAALLGASLLAAACAKGPRVELVTPAAARVRVGQIDRVALETAITSAPPGLRERTEYLVDLLWQAGCVAVEMPRPGESRTPDVVCSLPGRTTQRILVLAHLDREVDENGVPRHWSGSAILPFLYRALGVEEREHSFEFAACGKGPRGRARNHTTRLGSPLGEDLRAIVEIQDLDPATIGFSSTDPGLGQGFVATSLAVGRPLDSLRPFTHRLLRNRRMRIPTLVIVSPSRSGAREELPAVSAPRDAGPEGYHSAARLVAAYLGYLDETLRLRVRAPAPAGIGER